MLCLFGTAVGDLEKTVEVVEVRVGLLTVHHNVDLVREVFLDLLLSFLDWKLGLQVALTVQLRSLDETLVATRLVRGLQHDAVGRDLLFVLQNDNVADFDVAQAGLDDVVLALRQISDLVNGRAVDLLVCLVPSVVSNALLDDTDQDDDAKDDGDNQRGVNGDLGE